MVVLDDGVSLGLEKSRAKREAGEGCVVLESVIGLTDWWDLFFHEPQARALRVGLKYKLTSKTVKHVLTVAITNLVVTLTVLGLKWCSRVFAGRERLRLLPFSRRKHAIYLFRNPSVCPRSCRINYSGLEVTTAGMGVPLKAGGVGPRRSFGVREACFFEEGRTESALASGVMMTWGAQACRRKTTRGRGEIIASTAGGARRGARARTRRRVRSRRMFRGESAVPFSVFR